jgi:hypothetical protein
MYYDKNVTNPVSKEVLNNRKRHLSMKPSAIKKRERYANDQEYRLSIQTYMNNRNRNKNKNKRI